MSLGGGICIGLRQPENPRKKNLSATLLVFFTTIYGLLRSPDKPGAAKKLGNPDFFEKSKREHNWIRYYNGLVFRWSSAAEKTPMRRRFADPGLFGLAGPMLSSFRKHLCPRNVRSSPRTEHVDHLN